MIRELAPAKVNLLLHVAGRRADGLHELCSLVASIELADELLVEPADGAADVVDCPGVEGPNLVSGALAAFRSVAPLPPLRVAVKKRIPVAAGLGGGSADAAAALRAANRLAGQPLGPGRLRELGARLGADVPSQVDPRHALVTGAGERIEPLELPRMALVLAAQPVGLSTARVYSEADRLNRLRSRLQPDRARSLASEPLRLLASELENDLEPAALALRPELAGTLAALRSAGALAARLTGSGPTAFGIFERQEAAERAAASLPGSLVTMLRER